MELHEIAYLGKLEKIFLTSDVNSSVQTMCTLPHLHLGRCFHCFLSNDDSVKRVTWLAVLIECTIQEQ